MANTKGVADHKAANTNIPGLTASARNPSCCCSSSCSASSRPVCPSRASAAAVHIGPGEHGDHRRHRRHRIRICVVAQQQLDRGRRAGPAGLNAVKLAQDTGNAVNMPGEVVPMSEMISDPDAKTTTE
mgnify:CR=1 FL=1